MRVFLSWRSGEAPGAIDCVLHISYVRGRLHTSNLYRLHMRIPKKYNRVHKQKPTQFTVCWRRHNSIYFEPSLLIPALLVAFLAFYCRHFLSIAYLNSFKMLFSGSVLLFLIALAHMVLCTPEYYSVGVLVPAPKDDVFNMSLRADLIVSSRSWVYPKVPLRKS